MTPEELCEIITQREGLKLDFKHEYKLGKSPPAGMSVRHQDWNQYIKGQWLEFTKDILAVTDGNVGTADDPGILIIGAGDELFPDGTRQLYDVAHLGLTSAQILDKVNERCRPRIPDIQRELIELDGCSVYVITIPPSPHTQEITEWFHIPKLETDTTTGWSRASKKRKVYSEGTGAEKSLVLASPMEVLVFIPIVIAPTVESEYSRTLDTPE